MISIIIPTLNAADGLMRALPPLVPGVAAGMVRELIIADAGSTDRTLAIADAAGAVVVRAALGEGAQSIAGAVSARGDWLLFLHAEAALHADWIEAAARFMNEGDGRAGVFGYRLARPGPAARAAEAWRMARTAWFKAPLRAQGLLIARSLYDRVGGYAAAPGAHRDLVERIGGARLALLRARVTMPG
jgi:glycosyltransferase involved in cell wall biosynthesis